MPLMLILLCLLLMVPAVYAQARLSRFTRGQGRLWGVRLLLIVTGIAFGWLGAAAAPDTATRILNILIGVGIVHVPAAVILFVKGRRGSGKS